MISEFPHIIELLGVLATILLAIVQYFDVENKNKIIKLKDSISQKKLPPETKEDKNEIIKMRKDWDDLVNKEDFCRANALILVLLGLLASYVLFTTAYIVQCIFFSNTYPNLCNWYLLIGSSGLLILSSWCAIWLVTTKGELSTFSFNIKTFVRSYEIYEAYKPVKTRKRK